MGRLMCPRPCRIKRKFTDKIYRSVIFLLEFVHNKFLRKLGRKRFTAQNHDVFYPDGFIESASSPSNSVLTTPLLVLSSTVLVIYYTMMELITSKGQEVQYPHFSPYYFKFAQPRGKNLGSFGFLFIF